MSMFFDLFEIAGHESEVGSLFKTYFGGVRTSQRMMLSLIEICFFGMQFKTFVEIILRRDGADSRLGEEQMLGASNTYIKFQ